MKLILLTFTLALATPSVLANFVIQTGDGFDNQDYREPTNSNTGETIGDQRLNVFREATRILETELKIAFPVVIEVNFEPLLCGNDGAVFGQAGPTAYEREANSDELIPLALHNQIKGISDSIGADIFVTLNSRIDEGCFNGEVWDYGFETGSSNGVSALSVIVHEIIHGLGFLSLMEGDGDMPFRGYVDGELVPLYDGFTKNLYSITYNTNLSNLPGFRRQSSMRSIDKLVWNGDNANAAAAALTTGLTDGMIQIFAPNPYESGSSTSHFSTALTPDEVMEPYEEGSELNLSLSIPALADIGWTPNYPPVLTDVGGQTTPEETPISLTLSATDDNNDPLEFSAEANSDSISASLTGTTLTITPATDFYGDATVTVAVTDGAKSDTGIINVTVTPVNDAPQISSPGNQITDEDTPLSITLAATDVDSTELTYSVISAPAEVSATIDSNTLTLTPGLNYNGEESVTIRVSDGELSDEVTFTVTVNPVDDAPILASIGNQTLAEDSSLHIPLNAIDVDGDPLTFEVVQAEPELNATISGNALNIEPVADYYGSSEVTVRAAGSLSSDQETFTVTVSAENDAPQITAISDQSVATDTPLTISLEGSDVDGDSLTYMASSSDESVILTAIDGASLTLSAASEYNGSAVITVVASDGELSATTDFTATVSGGQDIAPLSISVNGEDVQDDATLLLSALESATLSAAGGNGIYEFNAVFDGSIRSDLLTGSGTTRTLMAPEDGAFAGTYAITIDDTHGSSTPVRFSIRRPLILSTDVTPLLEGTRTGKLIIEGGSIGERITLAASELDFIDNEGELANDLPGPTENAAEGYNAVSALIDAAEPGDYQLVAESAGTGSTELDVTVVAARTLNLSVIDAQGLAIESVVVSLTDERTNQWGLTESYTSASAEYVDRQFAIRLPALTQEIRIDAKGFDSQIISSDTSETSKIVELSLADGFFHLSGKVLSEGIDFSAEAPELIITLANGNTTTPDSVRVLSAKELEVEWVTELAVADPVSITISHSQSDDVVINLDDALGKQELEATLILKETSKSPENGGSDGNTDTGSGSGGSGGGNAAWLLVTAFALIGRRRLKTS